MRVVGINDNYTMSVPLEILNLIAGDFDGDTLSIMYIINKAIEQAAEEVYSPRYAMYISRNDGMFNNDINHQKDIIIAACNLIDTCRQYYTDEELSIIYKAKNMDDIIPVGDISTDTISPETSIGLASVSKLYGNNLDKAQNFKEFLDECRHYINVYNLVFDN